MWSSSQNPRGALRTEAALVVRPPCGPSPGIRSLPLPPAYSRPLVLQFTPCIPETAIVSCQMDENYISYNSETSPTVLVCLRPEAAGAGGTVRGSLCFTARLTLVSSLASCPLPPGAVARREGGGVGDGRSYPTGAAWHSAGVFWWVFPTDFLFLDLACVPWQCLCRMLRAVALIQTARLPPSLSSKVSFGPHHTESCWGPTFPPSSLHGQASLFQAQHFGCTIMRV